MSDHTINLELRHPAQGVTVLVIHGAVTAASESALTDAHNIATNQGAKALLLNFSDLEYMNSSGIGLLVTLLVRANRQGQQLLAYGLSDHYRHIFELTRLTDAIGVHDNEADALSAASRTK
jgi:anti-sigma B factor antagonist